MITSFNNYLIVQKLFAVENLYFYSRLILKEIFFIEHIF